MKTNIHVLLPDATIEELESGYTFDGTHFSCLACGTRYEKGRIYPVKDAFYDAEKRMILHIAEKHGSVFAFLSGLDKEYTDLTTQQRYALELFYKGESDAEIAKALKVEPSTVRNYRFILRRKERQAKVFIAMMRLYDDHKNTTVASQAHMSNDSVSLPGGFSMEGAEYEKLRKAIFTDDGRIKYLPSKRKHLTLVLTELIKRFDFETRYTELEVNEILAGAYSDYATLRRELIDYKLLSRKSDCSEYWVSPQL